MTTAQILTIVFSVLGVTGVAVSFYFGVILSLTTRIGKLENATECLPDIGEKVTRMYYRQELTDEIMVKQAAAQIHSPIHHERDDLVDKLKAGTLSPVEAKELIWRLELMLADNPTPGDRWGGAVLLVRAHEIADGKDARAPLPIGDLQHGHI